MQVSCLEKHSISIGSDEQLAEWGRQPLQSASRQETVRSRVRYLGNPPKAQICPRRALHQLLLQGWCPIMVPQLLRKDAGSRTSSDAPLQGLGKARSDARAAPSWAGLMRGHSSDEGKAKAQELGLSGPVWFCALPGWGFPTSLMSPVASGSLGICQLFAAVLVLWPKAAWSNPPCFGTLEHRFPGGIWTRVQAGLVSTQACITETLDPQTTLPGCSYPLDDPIPTSATFSSYYGSRY